MTVRGHVKAGKVILHEPLDVPDGTPVEVSAVETVTTQTVPRPGSREAMQLLDEVSWVGGLGELRRLQQEVQEMRNEDMRVFGRRYDSSPLDAE